MPLALHYWEDLDISIPFGKEKKASFNIDFEAEYSNRRGEGVSGIGGEDQSFQNSHVSINFGIGF